MSRFETSIGDFVVKVDSIRWSVSQALVVYEYPFIDGAKIENHGSGARRFSLSSYWMNSRYSDGFLFLKWADSERGVIEFIHPEEGVVRGRIERADPLVDNRKDFLQVGIEFIEETVGIELSESVFSVRSEIEGKAVAVVSMMEQSFETAVSGRIYSNLPPSAAELAAMKVLRTPVKPNLSILATPFGKIPSAVRSMLRGVDAGLSVIDTITDSVALSADSLTASMSFATSVPGRVVSSVTRAVAAIGQLVRSSTAAPSRIQSMLKSRITDLKREVAAVAGTSYPLLESVIDQAQAVQISVETSYCYDDDNRVRDVYFARIDAPLFTEDGTVIHAQPVPTVLTVPELEASLYEARRVIDVVYQKDRAHLHLLKEMAYSLERHVSAVKLTKDKLMSVNTGGRIVPIHVLIRERGLSSRYLELVMALNPSIENPTFASGEILVHERQGSD